MRAPEDAWPVASIILGRPGATTVDVSVMPSEPIGGFIRYYADGEAEVAETPPRWFKGGEPTVISLTGLKPDTAYRYRLCYRVRAADEVAAGPEYSFHTQRAPGSSFVFTIVADSHLGTAKHCDPELYARTLANALADGPDFHLDLGDTFRVTHVRNVTSTSIDRLFTDQRAYMGLLCHSAPLFLAIGNHEHEWGFDLPDGVDSISARMTMRRKLFLPNPSPGGIYSGNTAFEPDIGQPQNYYAWEWGDALFVVLDPYRYMTVRPDQGHEMWDWTLGHDQYEWLRRTLADSKRTFRFVFLHHILGSCRGGAELVDLFEWGGRGRTGLYAFAQERQGWEMPIHDLLVRNGVTAVFQGHDHVFAHQSRDGIVYQTCPMPGDPTYTAYNRRSFRSGSVFANSGHVRVSVSPVAIKVEYIRAFLPADESDVQRNGRAVYSYTVKTQSKEGAKNDS